MAGSFMKKVQNTPKVKAVRQRIAKKKAELKRESSIFKRLIKSESKRLGRTLKKKEKSKRKKRK